MRQYRSKLEWLAVSVALIWSLSVTEAIHAAEVPIDKVVEIEMGKVRGAVIDGDMPVLVFKGIPYAGPPTGRYRWKPPRPAESWKGIRNALEFSPGCPQPDVRIVNRVKRQDEDCLYLNIWTTPSPERKKPVMVWIHGGAMVSGIGSMPYYDGRELARCGVVLVTINYRLGPLGFLAHPALSKESKRKVSGNYGLLDQIAALKWVKRNIATFGGDPGNVTIFGESAGAVSVNCLLVSPLAKDLFHRVIMQSGTVAKTTDTLAQKEKEGLDLTEATGAKNISDLRKCNPGQMLSALPPRIGLSFGRGGIRYTPNVDGYVLPADPQELMAKGRINKVPVIIGTNAEETTLFLGRRNVPRTVAGYRTIVRFLFGDHWEEALKQFPAGTGEDILPAMTRLTTVSAYIAPARRNARLLSKAGAAVYMYHFMRVPDVMLKTGLSATHGIEIPYVFNSSRKLLAADTDRRLAGQIQRYWVSFARSGVPGKEDGVTWPRYEEKSDACLILDSEIRGVEGLYRNVCDLMDRVDASKKK